MKAIENFIVEATNQFGSEAVITVDQAKKVLKDIKRSIGIGHLKQSGMVTGMGEFAQVKLKPVGISKKDIVKEVQVNVPAPVVQVPQESMSVNLVMSSNIENLVPSKFEGFVPWGHTSTIKQIVKSGLYYPLFVTGLSGNGKTLMIEQIHAEMKKELIRVNITIETDEDDLLGGFRLVNGETKFVPGPVIEAMNRGCTLLLDEIDLGSNKLMCLQPVLEGKGVYLKKVNQWVTPKKGFNVMATANTKGRGLMTVCSLVLTFLMKHSLKDLQLL